MYTCNRTLFLSPMIVAALMSVTYVDGSSSYHPGMKTSYLRKHSTRKFPVFRFVLRSRTTVLPLLMSGLSSLNTGFVFTENFSRSLLPLATHSIFLFIPVANKIRDIPNVFAYMSKYASSNDSAENSAELTKILPLLLALPSPN